MREALLPYLRLVRAPAVFSALGDPASSRGGTSFWHVNLNLAFPIRSLSRPLIPDEEAFEDVDGKPVTLKQVLRNAVNVSGPALMEAALKEQGMSTADARKEAQAALAEIRPAVDYIVDDANLYAIRPLLMIDAAGLAGGLNGNSGHWLAVGAGIGVTVVTARLEAGYMQTISGPEFEPRSGSFFEVVCIVGPPLSLKKKTSVSSSSPLSRSLASTWPIASSIAESIAA